MEKKEFNELIDAISDFIYENFYNHPHYNGVVASDAFSNIFDFEDSIIDIIENWQYKNAMVGFIKEHFNNGPVPNYIYSLSFKNVDDMVQKIKKRLKEVRRLA